MPTRNWAKGLLKHSQEKLMERQIDFIKPRQIRSAIKNGDAKVIKAEGGKKKVFLNYHGKNIAVIMTKDLKYIITAYETEAPRIVFTPREVREAVYCGRAQMSRHGNRFEVLLSKDGGDYLVTLNQSKNVIIRLVPLAANQTADQ